MAAPQEWFDDPKAANAAQDSASEVPLTRRQRLATWLHSNTRIFIITNLLLILLLVFLWNRIVVVIPPGQAGVLFRLFSGTEIDHVYEEGFHMINPLNNMTLYEARRQLMRHEFDVITAKGLSVKLSLAIRYRPEIETLGLLHQRIGPDYASRVLVPQIESVMRKQLGRYVAEDIYTNKDGLLTRAILSALEEVGRNFIDVEDIIIRSMTMPEKITVAIEDKLSQEELTKSYEFRLQTARQEAERLAIEAEGRKRHNTILTESLNPKLLQHEQIEAMRELAKSPNTKTLIMGGPQAGAQGDSKLLLNVTP